MQKKIANICLFLTPACVFVFPGSYWLGALMFSSICVWMMVRRQVGIGDVISAVRDIPMVQGFMIYVVLYLSLCIYHEEASKDFGNIIPFLMAPLIFTAVSKNSVDPKNFWYGCATGALLAFLIGMYQVYVLNVDRAFGFRNPIMFGNTAIILGTGSLVGFVFYKTVYEQMGTRLYLLFCGIAGLITSLLSGTKGGWLSLAMIVAMLTSAITHSLHWVKRVLIGAGVLLTIAFAALLIPKLPIVDRMSSAYVGAVTWIETGEVTEGSASIRLESFKAGLMAGARSPILGLGKKGEQVAIREMVDAGLVSKQMTDVSVHNDFISVFSQHGLLGVFGITAVHLGIFWTFWRHRTQSDEAVKAIISMGVLLVFFYMEFGLTMSIFGTSIFRTMYISWSILLAGLLISEMRRLASAAPPA
jgi:O-antigen ligase